MSTGAERSSTTGPAVATGAAVLGAWVALAFMAVPVPGGGGALAAWRELCGRGALDATLPSLVLMWSLMAVAMMLPGAWPMLRTHAQLPRDAAGAVAGTGWLAAGYLAVWFLFALMAAFAQQQLAEQRLLDADGATRHAAADALLFAGAGLYQFSRLREACVRRCRSPLMFLMTHWRDGRAGAVTMGARHGLDCLGCCGALMLLAFVGGVMNLLWMAAATLLMTLEKLPAGARLSHPLGWMLLAAGAWSAGRALVMT